MRHHVTYLAIYVALSTAFCWPLLTDPAAAGSGDWDQHLFYYASVLRNAAFGQWPLWNPWYCGGNVLWANPQVSLVSPVYLLALVMPLALAMKLNIVGHYVLGFVGMHLLLRRSIGLRSPVVVIYPKSGTDAQPVALAANGGGPNSAFGVISGVASGKLVGALEHPPPANDKATRNAKPADD